MKKSEPARKSALSSATLKRRTAAKTVDEYLSALSEPARSRLQQLRGAARSAAPAAAEEVISYGIPALKDRKVLVWYAAFADHCSLFPTAEVIAAFQDELRGFSVRKGTIHFTHDKPLPVGLIKKLVRARVKSAAAAQ